MKKLKAKRSAYLSAFTRLYRKLEEAREETAEINEHEVVSLFEKLVQNRTLLETLGEQILDIVHTEEMEKEQIEEDEHSVDTDSKI